MPFFADKEANNPERQRTPALVVQELTAAVRTAMRAHQMTYYGGLPAEINNNGASLEELDAKVDTLIDEALKLGVEDNPVIQRIFTDVRAEF